MKRNMLILLELCLSHGESITMDINKYIQWKALV